MYTVLGDEVNVAERLEQLDKRYGTYALVSAATAHAAGAVFRFERVGEVRVRGRSTPTDICAPRGG